MSKTVPAYEVEIDSLSPYEKNPRRGNLQAIRESIRENGQFRPIVVWRETGQILGGNHTWMAMKAEGHTDIKIIYAEDVLEKPSITAEEAARIVLADNRTNDLATYDTNILAELLASLDSPVGTGYSDVDYEALVSSIESPTLSEEEITPRIFTDQDANDTYEQRLDDPAVPFGQEAPDDEEVGGDAEDTGPTLEGASEETKGAFGLKPDMDFEKGNSKWDIPPLRSSMLVQVDELPDNLLAWAGSATKDWPDPDQWWLYNFGIDSTSGMKDLTKMIVSFYCWDKYFEPWWDYPERYVTKMLNSGVKYAVVPDFSQWTSDARCVSLFNLYRNRWLGRYMQEAGIKVIPNLSWRMGDYWYLDNVVIPTLPDHIPVIGFQLQTFDKNLTDQELADLKAMVQHAFSNLSVDVILLYSGERGREFMEDCNLGVPIRFVEHRMRALADQAKNRQKKTTL